ncbi:MAG TPA: hypothetical protein PKL13_01380 [bacterium]|nr:hypothetical protein [bacterium]
MKIITETSEFDIRSSNGEDSLYLNDALVDQGQILFFDELVENINFMSLGSRTPRINKYLVLMSVDRGIIFQSSKIIKINY